MGIPMIGCGCNVCTSTNPHNKRMRPSALLKTGGRNFLIDCGPDFHQQALIYGIDHLEGVFLTHAHHDHTASLDELRIYHMRSGHVLPCLLSKETAEDIIRRFAYFFDPHNPYKKLTAKLDLQILEGDRGAVDFAGLNVRYCSYYQAGMKVNGFRFNNLAYVTDLRDFDDSLYADLEGVEILIVSALRLTPSHLHLTVDEALEFSRKVGAQKTYLTHIAHELDHESGNAYLPDNVRLAYDGLSLQFQI